MYQCGVRKKDNQMARNFPIAVLLAALLTFSAWAAQPAANADLPKAASSKNPLKALKSHTDKMRGITWYQHPTSPKYRNANGVYLYFGRNEDGTFTALRFVAQYYADDWLFVKHAWAKTDSTKVDLPEKSGWNGWERDNSGGKIWEWTDTALITPTEIAAVRALANAKSVTVRFEGRQYYNDRTLSVQQIKALKEVLSTYEAVTGKPL